MHEFIVGVYVGLGCMAGIGIVFGVSVIIYFSCDCLKKKRKGLRK